MAAVAIKVEEKGEWLSEAEIAKRCNLDRATVKRRLEDLGHEPDEERSGPKLKVHFFTDDMLLEIKSAKDSFSAARLQDLRWSAKLKQQKYEKESGELINRREVFERVAAIFAAMNKEVAIQMPKRIAKRLAQAKTAPEVAKILRVETEKVFLKLREKDEELA